MTGAGKLEGAFAVEMLGAGFEGDGLPAVSVVWILIICERGVDFDIDAAN